MEPSCVCVRACAAACVAKCECVYECVCVCVCGLYGISKHVSEREFLEVLRREFDRGEPAARPAVRLLHERVDLGGSRRFPSPRAVSAASRRTDKILTPRQTNTSPPLHERVFDPSWRIAFFPRAVISGARRGDAFSSSQV